MDVEKEKLLEGPEREVWKEVELRNRQDLPISNFHFYPVTVKVSHGLQFTPSTDSAGNYIRLKC